MDLMDMEKENMVTNEERAVLETQKETLQADIIASAYFRDARTLAFMNDAVVKIEALLAE